MTSFSCCWKDVRLKHEKRPEKRQRTLVSVVVERMYDWSYSISLKIKQSWEVSVVVERMYDWSQAWSSPHSQVPRVSVVVERMYDWSPESFKNAIVWLKFQLLLKGCTIEASIEAQSTNQKRSFQLLLKGCTIEALQGKSVTLQAFVSVVVERMYDWSLFVQARYSTLFNVSVVVERMYDWSSTSQLCHQITRRVSVVVERMYDWSSETNWLKTNDFWQLVSDLFFENGRSAQKVPLFSKIWGDLGDCLTVFDSCSNI